MAALQATQLDIVHSPVSSPPIMDWMLLDDNDTDGSNSQPNHKPDDPNIQDGSTATPSTAESAAQAPMSVDKAEAVSAQEDQPTPWGDLYSRMPLYGWFKVDDSVFCLDVSRHVDESPYMASLYRKLQDHQAGKSSGSDVPDPGVLQTSPITVEGLNTEDMILFMDVLKVHRGWNEYPLKDDVYPSDQMMRCTELARKWGLKSVEKLFIEKLDVPAQSPAFRLYAAAKFKNESLLHGAINDLVFTPLNKSRPSIDLLNFKIYRTITLARDAIMVQRAAIAGHFPTIPHMRGVEHNHDNCEVACDHLWQLHITTDLLSGRTPAPNAHDSFLKALADRDDINAECRDHLRSDLMTYPDWECTWGNESAILWQLRLKISRMIQDGSQD